MDTSPWRHQADRESPIYIQLFLNRAAVDDDMTGGFLSELEAPPANRSAAKPLASLEALVVVGSSVDDVVAPWQSTFFGAAEGSDEVVPLRERRLYEDDWIGLRALDERGGLAVHDCHCAHRAFDAALGDRMRRLLAAALGGRLVI